MTLAPDVRRVCASSPAEAIEVLRQAGLRVSTPRRMLIGALFDAGGPVSAIDLASTLSLEESSVYRNLEVLERQGLVRHIHLGHGPGLYTPSCDDEAEYLYCERCHAVTTLAPRELDPIRELIKSRFGYSPNFAHFAIVGSCEGCAAISADR